MSRKKSYSKSKVLQAIQGSSGFISTIASRLHCDWHTAKKFVDKWPETQQALIDEDESTIDFVEGKAIQRINDGDSSMIKFYLATKGRRRGYVTDDKQIPTDVHGDIDNTVRLIIDTTGTVNKGQ